MINADKTLNNVVDNVLLKRIGTRVVVIIRRRTAKGHFLPGSSRRANKYSEKPFALPYGAAQKNVRKKIDELPPEDVSFFISNKTGSVWVTMKKGYKSYRALSGRETDHVNLNWSGRMMAALKILPTEPSSFMTKVGFDDPDMKRLASWHNVLGAGKSKRLHKFLGLTKKEEQELAEWVGKDMAKKLAVSLAMHFNENQAA